LAWLNFESYLKKLVRSVGKLFSCVPILLEKIGDIRGIKEE